jgi:hypothetical protein
MRWSFLVPLAPLALAGCSTAPTYYSEVKPILDAHCASCHADGGVAPFRLDTFEDARAVKDLVSWTVQQRTMPPWGADSSVRPLKHDPSLSDAQIATIVDWADGGTPKGNEADEGPAITLDLGGIDRVDIELTLPEPYTPDPERLDDYRCFPLEWPYDTDTWITGFVGLPDYDPVVHHMLTFLVPEANAAKIYEWDANSDGPGYPCFGSVTPTDQAAEDIQVTMMGQWAPGLGALELAEGTGLHVPPGTLMVLQMHYTTAVDVLAPDQSTLGIQVATEPVDDTAYIVPWMDFGWVADNDRMAIPAGESEVRHHFQTQLTGSVQALSSGSGELPNGALIRSALPHMHKIGREISLTRIAPDGTEELFLHIPAYDFDWQREYLFEEPVEIGPQDEVRVDCRWDNSAEYRAQVGAIPAEPIDMGWGDGSYDEMCIALLTVTAR